MDILDDMGVSKLSAEVFYKVNYSFKIWQFITHFIMVEYRIDRNFRRDLVTFIIVNLKLNP